jgi:hypothetical protein
MAALQQLQQLCTHVGCLPHMHAPWLQQRIQPLLQVPSRALVALLQLPLRAGHLPWLLTLQLLAAAGGSGRAAARCIC